MGLERHCVRYGKVDSQFGKKALRCKKFAKNRGGGAQSPVCDGRLKGGGRSPGLLRRTKSCKRAKSRR